MLTPIAGLHWLASSERERQQALDIACALQQKESRDELGIGSVRDGIADLLFPGTSTLHTRARYFLLIRAYQHAAAHQGSSTLAARVRSAEAQLIATLKASDHNAGLIGRDAGADLKIVGEASTGREAVDRARRLAPDVVLMDVRMPDLDGIAATRELANAAPATKVLILTTFEQDDYIFGGLRAGASGFLLKRTRPEELIAAVHTIAAGDCLLSPSVTRRVIDRMAQQPTPSSATSQSSTSSHPASARCSS